MREKVVGDMILLDREVRPSSVTRAMNHRKAVARLGLLRFATKLRPFMTASTDLHPILPRLDDRRPGLGAARPACSRSRPARWDIAFTRSRRITIRPPAKSPTWRSSPTMTIWIACVSLPREWTSLRSSSKTSRPPPPRPVPASPGAACGAGPAYDSAPAAREDVPAIARFSRHAVFSDRVAGRLAHCIGKTRRPGDPQIRRLRI